MSEEGSAKTVGRTAFRFDLIGEGNGRDADFYNETLFPCVKQNSPGAVLFKLYYTSRPLKGAQYRSHPLSDGTCWNVQKCLFNDPETQA